MTETKYTESDLVAGRAAWTAGRTQDALTKWMEGLKEAYSIQDYAVAFVLSRNVAEAYATQQEIDTAILYFEYALALIDKCHLRNALSKYRVLEDSVTLVERRVEALKAVDKCTTCRQVDRELVVDEEDGCLYCKQCYDEYYATESRLWYSIPYLLSLRESSPTTCPPALLHCAAPNIVVGFASASSST